MRAGVCPNKPPGRLLGRRQYVRSFRKESNVLLRRISSRLTQDDSEGRAPATGQSLGVGRRRCSWAGRMSRGRSGNLPAALLLGTLAVALPALSGCQRGEPSRPGSKQSVKEQPAKKPAAAARSESSERERAEPKAEPTPEQLFSDWSKPPAAVIVISGQQHGYLEPCGCAPGFQKGGLARRYACLEWLRSRGWPVLSVDLGGLLEDRTAQVQPGHFRPGPEQIAIKLDISLKALNLMGYEAIGLGPEDIAIPEGFFGLVGLLVNLGEPSKPLGLNCNFSIDPALIEQGTLRNYLIRSVGPWTVGLTAVVGPSYGDRIRDSELKWQDPLEAEAVADAVAKLATGSDLQLLLYYGPLAEAKQLVKKYPQFDLVCHTSAYEEPVGKPEYLGDTMFVTPGTKGKHIIVVGLFGQGRPQLKSKLVPLDDRFPDDRSAEIRKLLDEDYLDALADRQLVQRAPKVPYTGVFGRGEFVGSEACADCHKHVYEHWLQTRHAHAMQTLRERGRHVNPECVNCHTVGFLYKGGYDGTPATAQLVNVGCENCHGPGGWHVQVLADPNSPEEDQQRAIQVMHVQRPTAERNQCEVCHDAENDPSFDLSVRWPNVVHSEPAERDRELWPKIREQVLKRMAAKKEQRRPEQQTTGQLKQQ